MIPSQQMTLFSGLLLISFLWAAILPMSSVADAPDSTTQTPIVLKDYLILSRLGRSGRSAVHMDPLEAQIVAGMTLHPKAGDTLALPNGGTATWEAATADAEGTLDQRGLGGGYAWTSVRVEQPAVMLLNAQGHTMAYVNGEPRAGDPYSYGYSRLPVSLHTGENTFLFQGARGSLKAKLIPPSAPALFNAGDVTLPDFVVGEKVATQGAIIVINASDSAITKGAIQAFGEGLKSVRTPLPIIPPLSMRKAPFRLAGSAPRKSGDVKVHLALSDGRAKAGLAEDHADVTVRVREPGQTRKVTFISDIDGSVQYYAVLPAHPTGKNAPASALFLSLHGASVEAIGQADAYEAKSWGALVAPTNRRPYGFDWEDWGRMDALEVLNLAEKTYKPDPQQVYLTGHSMGGHGTWIFGATYPDRFAAIGPSAGWISFTSYAGGQKAENPSPVEEILNRAGNPSDTLALSHNYEGLGVYILHGGADDNVPVTEARQMAEHLKTFHHDFVFHEQPDVGHWWDISPEPGADCVDWPPMFDMFAHHRLPGDQDVRNVDFTTASPGVSAWYRWTGIEAQLHPLAFSSVHLRRDPGLRLISGTTENVSRLALKLDGLEPGKPLSVNLDGQELKEIPWPETSGTLTLQRDGDKWSATGPPSPTLKGPQRYGPFKEAFRNRMVFVYGTKGTPEENAWAFAKARFDAETFWYRGNGSIDVLPDTAFDPEKEKDRNVILYGNADTNRLWEPLLKDSPVTIRRGRAKVGDRTFDGETLACLFVRTRTGSSTASVGVVSGTGLPGLRLTDRLNYFTSGVAFPDLFLADTSMLTEGVKGIRAAGFFGTDWAVSTGDFAWQDK